MTVPSYIFDKAWLDGNFIIPADKGIRVELRLKLESYIHKGIMFRSQNAKIRNMIEARLAAIEAHDKILAKR